MAPTIRRFASAVLISALASAALAQDAPPQTLFTNVNVFDGESPALLQDAQVLVEGNLIKTVSTDTIDAPAATVIDGGGRTLMPGLIESHVHLNYQHMIGGYDTIEMRDWQEIGAMGAATARALLLDGWTTIRDPGASLKGISDVIDRGEVIGPRLYQATAVIGQTGGHGDFRLKGQRRLSDRTSFRAGELGMTHIVDGRPATLSAARQNLANGADFLKMMMGGGIFSSKDPLHSRQSSDEEIEAVVEVADAWDTYVTAHIYRAEDAIRAIGFGLKEILHVPFLTPEAAQVFVENGVYYNPQLSASNPEALEVIFGPTESVNKSKARVAQQGMQQVVEILKSNPALMDLTVFGVDIVTVTPEAARRNRDFEMFFWAENFGNLATLKSMTSIGGKVAALTGQWNPYPDGPLGVIQEGAYADILLVEGNPLEDMTNLGANADQYGAPDRAAGQIDTMDLIMKDGVIYKNTLD
ncbi:MAG: amidohydrolase family protein [Dinoroseobacter sp.]|nr:amidohydrolase family protein [Dinoroseobacter sp.]